MGTKKLVGLIAIAAISLPLFAKEVNLSGIIVSTHDAAGGGYGIQTSKGVYSLCYVWDNEKMVDQLSKLEQSGQKIQLSGNQSDRFTIDCDSIKIKGTSKNRVKLQIIL